MKQIWSLFSALQIATHINLLSASIPANLYMCLQIIIDISNVNIVPEPVVNALFSTIEDSMTDFNNRFNTNDIFNIITFF